VTEMSGPWDGSDFREAGWRKLHRSFQDGVIPGPGNPLRVTASGSNRTISVEPGTAIIQGALYELLTTMTFDVPDSTSATAPYYRVVLVYNPANRRVNLRLRTATSPTALSVGDPAGDWFMAIATVEVATGAVTTARLTDDRVFVGAATLLPEPGYAFRASQSGPVTALTDVDGMTATIALPSRRKVKVEWSGQLTSNAVDTNVGVRLLRVGGRFRDATVPIHTANAGHAASLFIRDIAPPGTTTYKLQLGRFGGTGSAYITADPQELLVTDLGPI